MKRTTNSIKIAKPFEAGKNYNSKSIMFTVISITLFVSYGVLFWFLLIFGIDKIILNFVFFMSPIIFLTNYYYFSKTIKKKINETNSKNYFILSILLTLGVIILFLASFYFADLYFKTSVFDTENYLKNYDIVAQNVNKIGYPVILIIGISIFLINNLLRLRKENANLKKILILEFDELLRLIANLFFAFLISWLLGIFAFGIYNLGYPG